MQVYHRTRIASCSALLVALISPVAAAQIVFTDVSTAAGVDGDFYTSTTGHSLGMNFIDFDRDGWHDIFLVNGYDDPNDALVLKPHLYRNNRNGTFTRVDHLLPAMPNYDQGGSKFADYDNDGDLDIYVYTDNQYNSVTGPNPAFGPPNYLLKNLWFENGGGVVPGQPLFVDVAASVGVDDSGYRSKVAQWLDYDLDGCVDLYVGHWALQHDGEFANKDRMFRNLCDGTFEDVTDVIGMYPQPNVAEHSSFRPALAAISGHFNTGDLYPDLYVANVSGGVPGMHRLDGHVDQIYQNNGDGTFTEITFPGVGDDSQAAMGIDFADIDLDGGVDFYISDLIQHDRPNCTNCELELEPPFGNPLYMNDGFTISDDSAEFAGVVGASSWGVNFFDGDHDMYEDLFVSVGFDARGDPSLLYYNNKGDGTFLDITGDIQTTDARGSAIGDYDNDGDIDLAVVNQRGKLQLFRNDTPALGNYLMLNLVGTQSNRDAIGALVKVEVNGVVLQRTVKGGSSGHGQDPFTLHFGLGDAELIDRILIFWPSGVVQTKLNWPVNVKVKLTEPPAS